MNHMLIIFISVDIVLLLVLLVQIKSTQTLKQRSLAQAKLIDTLNDTLERQYYDLHEQLLQVQQQTTLADQNIAEMKQNSAHVTEQYQYLQTEIQQLQQLLTSQQPADKLYSRALKLAALGASAEELVQECELSTTEAEMLIAIHQRKK